ncbi:MAG: hypothetical protein MMC33_007559 [Icmadophila ericetorum]|nr:hypothetical protein [Icmadophila ericetorum]
MDSHKQPAKASKAMSSRLMTMKFMQRAAASSPITTSTPDRHSSRGQNSPGYSSQGTPIADILAIRSVVAAEEAKRQVAIDRAAAEAGETKWILSVQEAPTHGEKKELHVVSAGFEDIDNADGTLDSSIENLRPTVIGRRSFGKFNRALEKSKRPHSLSDSSDSSNSKVEASSAEDEDDEDLSEGEIGAQTSIRREREANLQRIKAQRKAEKKAAKAEARRLAEERQNKVVNLNKLTSISNSGYSMVRKPQKSKTSDKNPNRKKKKPRKSE